MSYRAEIAAMLRDMPSGWRRQYRVGRDTLARNGGPVLPETPSPEQAMRILGNTAGGKADADTARGDQPVPKAVRDAAMHGLRLSYTNNYGGWEFFGIARAIQLALMPSVPLRTRERMVRYLSDHARDKAGRSFGDERHPSNGYMAWLNWGGDPAVAWNERDGIGRATYGAAARRTNGVKTAAVEAAAKLGAKVGIKGGGKFVPFVGEALMAIDVAREGHSLYKRRKAGEQIGWKEGTASLASSAIIGPEGVAWAKKKLEARKAKKNPRYTSAVRTHPKLWESVKVEVTRGSRGGLPGQWSARKAQIAVALYQQRGGGYVGPKSPYNALDKWTREDWRTRSGRPSLETGERYLPAAAIAALSPEEYAITSRAKRAGMRHGEQFVPQPKRIAEKVRKYRRNPERERDTMGIPLDLTEAEAGEIIDLIFQSLPKTGAGLLEKCLKAQTFASNIDALLYLSGTDGKYRWWSGLRDCLGRAWLAGPAAVRSAASKFGMPRSPHHRGDDVQSLRAEYATYKKKVIDGSAFDAEVREWLRATGETVGYRRESPGAAWTPYEKTATPEAYVRAAWWVSEIGWLRAEQA